MAKGIAGLTTFLEQQEAKQAEISETQQNAIRAKEEIFWSGGLCFWGPGCREWP